MLSLGERAGLIAGRPLPLSRSVAIGGPFQVAGSTIHPALLGVCRPYLIDKTRKGPPHPLNNGCQHSWIVADRADLGQEPVLLDRGEIA
jgi:hypothetical protein